MKVNIFKKAHEYLDRMSLKYTIIPAACNVEAETYEFENSDSAVSGLAELTEMVSDWAPEYIRLSIELTPMHSYVTIEEGDEEWDYEDYEDEEE